MSKAVPKNIDVISLEWTSSPSRDRISSTLVCNYLRLQGVSVWDASIYDGFSAIHQSKPRLLFMTNTTGAVENFQAIKYAKQRGMLGASLVSEGMFKSNYLSEMIWGWNKDKILYEDVNMQWSEATYQMTIDLHPELTGRVQVSGGVGFDNYKINVNQDTKDRVLKKYNKVDYTKVIGIGCWDFGWLYPEDTRFSAYSDIFEYAQKERFKEDASIFDEILFQLASDNADILFLLKQHPGNQLGLRASGISKVSTLENTLLLMNEEPILDCIQASDIWMVYESTTAMEAWLLGRPTCLINPSGRDFPRDRLNEGSPAFDKAEQLQRVIDLLYTGSSIREFVDCAPRRMQLIKDVIQWDDGLNHVRAGNAILDLLEEKTQITLRDENWLQKIGRCTQHAKWLLGPYVIKSANFACSHANRLNFSVDELHEYQRTKLIEQEAFYRNKGLSLADLRQIRCL